MADIAELGFRLDTRDLIRGKGALDELSRSADHAGGSAGAFERRLDAVTAASRKAQQSADSLAAGFRGVAAAAGGLYVLDKALDSLRQFPALGIKAAASLETMQLGLAGTLASMGKIENKAIDIAKAQKIAADVTGVLQQKAMETAASTEDLVSAYRALLGPGLAAKMSMQQLVEFTVTGVNAVKSIGLQSNQVVQELRDLVAGGIQPASSTLATAIGVTDKDIAKIKKEGGDLFAFLMDRLSGFQQTSLLYNQTYSGRLDALREGMTKLAEQGFKPLFDGLKDGFAGALDAIGQTEKSVVMLNGKMQEVSKWKLDQDLVNNLQGIAIGMVDAGKAAIDAAKLAYEYRDAIATIAIAYAALKTSQITGAIAGGWTERIAASRAAMIADAQAAKVALERAAADNAVAIGASRRALAEKEAAMVALQKAQADVLATKSAMAAATTDAEKTIAAQRLAAAEYQRTEATGAAALASQKLSQSNAAATATATALAAAQRTVTATTTAAGVAARAFGGIIGALGGPIGIAITALIGLAFYWDEIKTKAFGAAESAESAANRIKTALASSNIAAANAGLDSLRASRSTIEKELGRVDAILKNESSLSALDVSKLTQQRQQLSQESEKVRSEILKSEAEIRKAKEGQAKQAVELVNGYASPLEKRLGLIKTETKAVADAMSGLPDVKAKYPTQLDDKDKKKKDKEAAKAAKELASEQAKLNDLLQKGEGFSTTYAEKLALLAKYQSKIPVDEYRAAVEKLILTETEAGKTAAKHAEEVVKLQDTFREEDAKRAANLQIQNEELQFQSSLLGKTALEQASLTAQWEEEKKIREEVLDLTNRQTQAEQDGNQWAATAIQDRIKMLESEAAARKEAAAGIAMQKEIQQQWNGISADIERALTDSLMRGFDSGKNFADSLKDYIKNAFKSLAIRILLQPVMGAVNAIGAPLFGAMSGVGQGGSASGFGGVSNLIGGLTSNSYGAGLSDMAAKIGSFAGFNTSPIPASFTSAFVDGSQAIYGFTDSVAKSTGVVDGFISNISSNAAAIPNWQFGLAGVGGGLAGNFIGKSIFGGKGYASSGGSLGGSLGSSLALAAGAGPLGIAAGLLGGSLLGGGLGSLFGDKKPDERKARFGYGASDALREEGLRTGWTGSSVFGQFRTYADKWFSGSEMSSAMGQFIDSLESLDNTVADSLKLTSSQTRSAIEALKAIDKEYSFGLQWGDFTANSKAREQIAVDRYATIFDSIDAGWGDFVRQFQGSFDEFPTYLQGVIAAMSLFREESGDLVDVFGKQIEGIGAFAEFAKAGENNADAFKRLYSVFQATNAVLESLGKSAKGTGLETTALRESFIKLAGGMESLAGYVQEYNEGFFTAAEKEAKVREQLQREFDKYNATLPTTRLEWRKLMESLDLSTQSGQEAAAKLYQLQGAFLSITPEIESATEAAKDFKDEIADLEQHFRDQLNAVDYSGMTEQGQQAASALDELTAKLARLSEIGGDVDLGVQAISRYIKTEIPKLYADALAPFKQSGGRGYTDLGKSIFEILSQAKTAVRAITEINNAELSASLKSLSRAQSEVSATAANSAKSVSFGGTKDYGIVRENGYKSSLDKLVNKYLTETGFSSEQIDNFGRGMLDAAGEFIQEASLWSANKDLFDQFKQEVANLGRVSDSEIKAFISSGKTNEQIYAAAQEFGISAARLSEVMGVSKEEIKQWAGTNALAALTPDEVYRSSAKYNPDKKAIEILDSVSGLLTVVQAATGGADYSNLDRLSVDPKEWRKAVADMLQAIPANAGYIMQDAINYAPSKFFSAGADKSFLRDYSDIDVTKDWSSLFSNPDMPSTQSFAKAAGLDFKTASDMLNSSSIVLNGLIDWAKVMTSSDPAKSLQGALNAISEDQTLMKLQNKWQQTQGYSSVGDVSGIPQFVDTVTPAIDAATEKAAEKIAEISASEVMSAADPVNALLQQSIGRNASAEERKQIEDAYNWGIANGKAIQDIVNDIASHAANLEQAVEKQVDATEKAATAATAVNNAPAHAGSYIQPSQLQIEEDQKARERHLAAIKELANGFLASVHNEMQSSFDALNKESQMIGLSAIGRAAKDATTLLKDRMQSIVDVITLTAEGLKEIGVADLLAKSTEFADAYISGTIKTTEELQSSLDSLFEGVDGAEDIKKSVIESAESSKKLFDGTAKQLRDQLVAPWQSAFDALAGNGIDAEISSAIKAKDQALADAKTLAESLGQNFDDLAKEIQRGFDAQLFGLTKQKLQGVIDSISKIADFQAGIDDAIFGLRVGMSGADVSGLYAQRQAEIKAQLDAAMQGDNLEEQIGLANKLRETITQRYEAEQQAQERMMSFARGLGDYLRQLRTSDKSTGSIYDRLTEAQKQFAEDVALSRGTGVEAEAARGRITNTSDTLLDLARQFYASGEGYQQIYNSVVGGLEGLQIDTRTEAERQLDAINAGNDSALKQIGELQSLRGTFDSKLGALQQQQATYIAEMQKLAEQLGLSQSAILQALKDLPLSISGAIAGIMPMPAVGGTGGAKAPTASSGGAAISQPAGTTLSRNAISDLLDRYLDIGGWSSSKGAISESDIQNTAASVGISAGDVRAIIETNKIDGSHKDGLSHVPFDGYVAELHKGERVLTASENRDYSADVSRIMGGGYGGQSVAPLLNEIKALRQEVAQLRQQQSSEHQDDLRQREAIAKQSMGQTKDLQTAMIRNTALSI